MKNQKLTIKETILIQTLKNILKISNLSSSSEAIDKINDIIIDVLKDIEKGNYNEN